MTDPTQDFRRLPDLASRALGGTVMFSNDDFYADAHRLIAPGPARHDPELFGDRGKVYDGWETRRRRGPDPDGSTGDSAVLRLGVPGIVRGVNIDTAYFRGNFPPQASVEVTTVLGYPTLAEVQAAEWVTIVDRAALEGDSANVVACSGETLATHVRLTIHPDGGVARFRVFGEAVPDPRLLGGRVDLAALAHGGLVEDCSNMFYSSPANVLSPGRAQVMSDGWETARRRDDGNDWLTVRLGAPGVLHEVVIDTSRFVGNAPGWAALTDADSGAELLPRTRLLPDTEHRFRLRATSAARVVRLDVYPDGGISRLRVLGTIPADARETLARRWLQLLPPGQASSVTPDDFFA